MENTAKGGELMCLGIMVCFIWNTIFSSKPIECGSVLRLQHLTTHLFLHSHNFRSPLSNNQEVSCFGDGGSEGDEGRICDICTHAHWM